jgi:hypothetical protein
MSNTDRELLELAAKAAGIALHLPTENGAWLENEVGVRWNPLTDDGDALRLAVKLGLLVYVLHVPAITCIRLPGEHIGDKKYDEVVYEHHLYDPYAATRRAIVRAAAEIGSNT